jgi:phage baseplate assembly protein W
MTKATDIVGRGWAFPFRFTTVGRTSKMVGVSRVASTEKIVMAMRQILGTRIGSRVIDRNFGSDLREILFTPIDEVSIARVRFAVTSAIQRWERRVELLDVAVDISSAQSGRIDVTVDFKVISTQEIGNLVYPLYITDEMRVQGQIDV